MSLYLIPRIFATPMASATDKMVLLAMADHAWDDGTRCYPSADRLAQFASVTRRTVLAAFKRLESEGYIIREGMSPLGTVLWRIPVQRLGVPSVHGGGEADSRGGVKDIHGGGEADSPNPSVTPQIHPSDTPNTSSDDDEPSWPSPEALVKLYNDRAPDNVSAVEALSPRRIQKAWRALRVWPQKSWWEEVFRQYQRSRFLSGKVTPSNGHAHFRPDFDWLLSTGKDGTENAVKVHDGAYDD